MLLQNDQKTDPINFLRFIEVRHGNKREFLPIAKILHIDASSNYTTIHADGYQPVMVAKVLKSAMANAEDQGIRNVGDLIVADARGDGGPMAKRLMPRARGMAYMIRRRSAHISIGLADLDTVLGVADKNND